MVSDIPMRLSYDGTGVNIRCNVERHCNPEESSCASPELTTHYSSCKVTISFYDCLVVIAVALVTSTFQFALR